VFREREERGGATGKETEGFMGLEISRGEKKNGPVRC